MDVKYINPFLEAFSSVMPMLGLTEIKKNGVTVKGRNIESSGVMIIVGIIGDIKGNVIYSISIENAKKIASTMMMGMPVEELGEIAQSAISELTNMLTANAATNYSMMNVNVNISTPTLMYGEFSANSCTDNVLCVEMLINGMSFDVNIALEKTINV